MNCDYLLGTIEEISNILNSNLRDCYILGDSDAWKLQRVKIIVKLTMFNFVLYFCFWNNYCWIL